MPNSHKKLHLGCGNVNIAEWLNIDLESPTADMRLDLTKPLPFDDCSVTHIFNEHFIEHISWSEAISFLSECRRILSPNGVIRITTPNLRFLIASYLHASKDEWGDLWQPDTPCLLMNEGMRSWGHQFVYDADELVRILVEAGFNSISFQEYRKSEDKELCELESRPFHNELILEARKTEDPMRSINWQVVEQNEDQWAFKLKNELVRRLKSAEQFTAVQANHIRQIETDRSAQTGVIAQFEKEFTDQANHIHTIEAELIRLQSSLCEECKSGLSLLYSLIKK